MKNQRRKLQLAIKSPEPEKSRNQATTSEKCNIHTNGAGGRRSLARWLDSTSQKIKHKKKEGGWIQGCPASIDLGLGTEDPIPNAWRGVLVSKRRESHAQTPKSNHILKNIF